MVTKPISGVLHVIVYVGFIIINIELLEILIDGITGSHRFFSKYFNTNFYNFLIASFEIFALLVLISVIIFWTRRNIMKIKSSLKSIKKRDLNSKMVRRRGRVYIINKTNPKFKARQK